jgi:putative transcriptional regulator
MVNNKQTVNITQARGMLQHPAKQLLHSYLFTYRNVQGINQTDLAKLVGVSRTTIQSIEQDRSVPSVLTALKLAHVLQTPVDSLFQIKYELPREVQYNRFMRRYGR